MAKKKNNEEMVSFKANVTLPKEEYENIKEVRYILIKGFEETMVD